MEPWLEGEANVVERPVPARDEAMLGLFDEHYLPLCRLAFVILGNHALAEEIVMEALLKTFSGWGRLRDPSRADIYLRRVVINLARSKIRRRTLERRTNESMAREPRGGLVDLDARETTAVVWAAVRELPERQRAAVVLRYYEDLPVAQVAEILDCSVGTVKSQLSKARAKLNLSLRDETDGGES